MGVGGEIGQPLGMGVLRQFSLAGNRVAALHLATRVFLARKYISDKQRDREQERTREKRRQNLRNLSKERLERSQGRRENVMKNTVKPREIERAGDKTLIYKQRLAFRYYFYMSSDSFVLFGGNILHNPQINCLISWVRF